MDKWVGRVALVTGVSSGIGEEIAKSLVEHGMTVVGIARRIERVQRLSGSLGDQKGKLFPYKCDLESDEEIDNLFKYIRTNFGTLDVCINNAGYIGNNTCLLNGDSKEWRKLMNINVIALCQCNKLAVELMQEKKVDDGYIINICGIWGHKVFHYSNGHFCMASKHAVRALTEGLRQEVKELKSGIRVTSISPGIVSTKISDVAFANVPQEVSLKVMKECVPLTTKNVADTVVSVLSTPNAVEINDIYLTPTKDWNLS